MGDRAEVSGRRRPADPLLRPPRELLAALRQGADDYGQQHLQRLAHGRRLARQVAALGPCRSWCSARIYGQREIFCVGPLPPSLKQGDFPRARRRYPPDCAPTSNQPLLSQRGRSCHPGSAARRISIHSGVTPGRVASSSRACVFVWVTQEITAGASPSSGWQANSSRMPLGS